MSYTLRDLPLPVKVVATVFLMAVGAGYLSAMVQLHMQDAKGGTPMPTLDEVVMKYTGKKWFDGPPPPPVSHLESLVMGQVDGAPWNGTGSMAPAFFHKDGGEYNRRLKDNPADKPQIDAERNGERELLRLWINAPDAVREETYANDKCPIDVDKAPRQISGEFKHADGSFKIKTLIEERCARCHSAGGAQANYPLETYVQIKKYLAVPPAPVVPPGGGWVKVQEPMSREKLTQSTHAHLLSWAMLFSLTGVIFAFSSYPVSWRCVLGPWVVIAVFADVSLWWLARYCDQWGPYFAQAIIGTGIAAGAGLFGQIVLSLFNLYGTKGKLVIGALILLGAGITGLVWVNKIDPALKEKEKLQQQGNGPAPAPKPADPKKDGKKVEAPKNGNDKKVEPPKSELSPMERVLALPVKGENGKAPALPFKGAEKGGMVQAFFNRDDGEPRFKDMMKSGTEEEKKKITAERFSELAAIQAWIKSAEPQRKAAYAADAFDFDLKGQPLTETYHAGGKVKVKSILTDRCARCHTPGGDNEDVLFNSYENIQKALTPPAAVNGTNGAPPPQPAPAPAPPKAVDVIPPAKDD